MKLLKNMEENDFEQLLVCQDRKSGLKAAIAIHSTARGPALGGTRMWPYSSEEEAFNDVLHLARAMSYKNAVAGLPLGGGKGVIIGDPEKDKSETLFRTYGSFIDRLQGWYITAEDAGTCPEDMDLIASQTRWALGTTSSGGDPSPSTARGVKQGMKAALEHLYGTKDLAGRVIAVQGAGHVGAFLCRLLAEDGAKLVISDINRDKADYIAAELGATVVSPEEITEVSCDIFAPCALGAVINDDTLGRLKCSIVAGAANNVLKEYKHGYGLFHRGILYAPDYVVNAGGVIFVADQLESHDPERVMRRIHGIYDTCKEIFRLAEKDGIAPFVAADRIAERRMVKGSTENEAVG
ncbi:MAG: Glu/Leu/Phe/Val dehydrogenase [Desulfobacterales bacterium]|nr:Glu/Leu/Phe/Val dehydrogenase [Desulfobacterales bacterium]